MTEPVVVAGAGGHARVLIEALRQAGVPILGLLDPLEALWGTEVDGVRVLGGDDKAPAGAALVNGVGGAASTAARRKLFDSFKAAGRRFAVVAAPSAAVARAAELAEGCQVLTRAVVHPGSSIGLNAVVNTAAVVEHDCRVGAHAFVGPGAVLCGGVAVGEGAFIGAGAVVLPGIAIGARALVAAGAVVHHDVADDARMLGRGKR